MSELAAVAHVLRRTTFGPFPGMVEELAGREIGAVIDAVVGAAPLVPKTPEYTGDSGDRPNGPVARWLRLMADRKAGLHEKLVWFWHGHFATSYSKVDTWELMWQQHLVLRRYALGNFREFAHAMVIDGAMLQWLDGAGSEASSPNENHARELMELFTVGRGIYSQEDVRQAAVAMSGWDVTDDGAVRFVRDAGNQRPVPFLGKTVTTAHDVVDMLCDRPECARFIAGKLHRYLVGVPPSEERLSELAGIFTAAKLEITPLAEAILRHPTFDAAVHARPRYPVEWVTAAMAVAGVDDPIGAFYAMGDLGQMPFYPPNVAGWPPGTGWLDAGAALARASVVVHAPAIPELAAAADPVAAIFTRAGIYAPTPATETAARDLAYALRHNKSQAVTAVLALILTAPEFTLA
ncbi:DUF1800 domain-containing protein [Nocardia sp. 2]|uniref:DUF1800 domain-containing protein n=1 Tax=Nocardia acididurans TaxID=2802282 RepID=A0ABS1MB85_9NOCA|nr:DUF1800 family protein [Nocardia acididurans]MBL1077872.1 DUF1800 domain-containing protein [Nocardia acididurans]